MRWGLGCYRSVTPALELVSFSFTTARVADIGRQGEGTASASEIGRSGGDLYVTYGLSGKWSGRLDSRQVAAGGRAMPEGSRPTKKPNENEL